MTLYLLANYWYEKSYIPYSSDKKIIKNDSSKNHGWKGKILSVLR